MAELKSDYMRYAYGFSDEKPSVGFWLILAGLIVFVLLNMFSIMARAQELEPIKTVFCDKPEQVETWVRELQKGAAPQAALDTVNKAAGGTINACAYLNGMGIAGKQMSGPYYIDNVGNVTVVEVLLVGVITPQGPMKVNPPAVQYVPRLEPDTKS